MRLTLRAVRVVVLAFLAASLAAEAQQPGKPARLGILYGAAPAFRPETDASDRALVAGLRDHGHVAGRNVVIEFRSALGTLDRFPGLATELVGLGGDVIVTTTEPGVRAAQDANRTIPIVMAGASIDPVASGFVASLARPGGNITGVTLGDLAGKRVELLREAVPGLRSVAAFHGDLVGGLVAGPAPGAERLARVGFFGVAGWGMLDSFRRALAERGWVEGENLVLSHRVAADSVEFLRQAQELAGEVDVIVAGSLNAARTARRATRTVPIVMWGAPDPVRWGLVASRTHPGGNVTGVEDSGPLQARGRVGLLREVLPGLVRLAVLVDPGQADHREALKEIQAAAGDAGLTVRPVEVSGPDTEVFILGQRVRQDALHRFEAGIRVLDPGGGEALIVLPRSREADLALQHLATKHRVPSLHGHAAAPVKFAGLLWLVSWPDRPRQVARFVDRILRGARPEDLPVEDAGARLVVNLKTAKALGLTIPPSVLARADEVIN